MDDDWICPLCVKRCKLKDNAVFCAKCCKWYHISCEAIPLDAYLDMAKMEQEYLCCECTCENGNFQYRWCLERLNADLEDLPNRAKMMPTAAEKEKKPVASSKVTKKIGGTNNGDERKVRVKRLPRFYPTEDRPKKLKNHQKTFSQHKRKLRSTISPGTILILVAGRHKGKRVIFLKQLGTGLLLVTGPYHLNGCPLRRINQRYVIATKTKLDIKGVKIPDRLTDEYFRRQKAKKAKHAEGDIFETKKEVYTVSEERKEDQKAVDRQLLDVIRKHPMKKLMFGYLGSMFSLSNGQYPHKMVF